MRASALIDTGAIVALVDARDSWHSSCVQALGGLRLSLVTSAAVLAEVFHLITGRRGREAVWRMIQHRAITVSPIVDADMERIHALMTQDADMDFADATLVHLARRESLATIFTTDNDDFETYRIEGRKKFTVVPGRR